MQQRLFVFFSALLILLAMPAFAQMEEAPLLEQGQEQTLMERIHEGVSKGGDTQAEMKAIENDILATVPSDVIERVKQKGAELEERRKKLNEDLEGVDSSEYSFIFSGLPLMPGADFTQAPGQVYDSTKSERANKIRMEWYAIMKETQDMLKELDKAMAEAKKQKRR